MIKNTAELVSIADVLNALLALWFTVRSFKKQFQLTFFSEYTKRLQDLIGCLVDLLYRCLVLVVLPTKHIHNDCINIEDK